MSGSVAVAAPVEGGKRGELFGGALTDEALDSSRSVLGTTRFGEHARAAAVLHAAGGRGVHQAGDRPAGASACARPHRRQWRAACALAARSALRRGDRRRSGQGRRLSRDHRRRAARVSDAAQAGRAGPADRRQPAVRADVDRRRRARGEQHGRGVAHEPRAAGPPGRRSVHLRARPLPPRGSLARGRGRRVRHRGVQRPVRGRGPALSDRVLRRAGGPQRRRRPRGGGGGFQGRARRASAQPRNQDRAAPGGPLLPRHALLPARRPGRTVAARRARA